MTTKYLARLPFRPAAMKSATSLLLGAALATAFFLLYTSLCRDLGAGNMPPARSPPPPWNRTAVRSAAAAEQEDQDEEVTQQVATTEEPAKQRIVMPSAPVSKQV